VLDGFEELKVCTAYQRGPDIVTEMPSDSAQLAGCTPVYETLKGWSAPTRGATQFSDLPSRARDYIRALEIVSEVPVVLISTGSERTHTIFREGTIAEGWASNREAGV
jgi:adenylosuccinate synthase